MAETKPKRKRRTKAQMLEEKLNEIEQEAKDYEKDYERTEFPPVVLPCRGYFKFLDSGMYVENLQYALNRIMGANVPTTGIYDEETMAAVEKFEEKYGGCVNGKFGETELIAYNKLRGVE